MPANYRLITNNDIAYLWWSVPAKIPRCVGFSIHRQLEGAATSTPLMTGVGFERSPTKKVKRTSDVWPIQSFQWKDVDAPRDGRFLYKIYAVRSTAPSATVDPLPYLVRDPQPVITTKLVALQEQLGKLRVVFNRGLLSTQAMNRGSNAPARNAANLRSAIGTPANKVRLRLTRELLPTLGELFRRAREDGGTCYAALYELTDEELVDALEDTGNIELILSNANSSKKVGGKTQTIYDGTNDGTRKRLRLDHDLDLTDRLLKGSAIGHNKFIVYEDKARKLTSVLTGSTNWTSTGLCGQTNNAVLIDDPSLAAHYHEYWRKLRNEQGSLQSTELRKWARENPKQVTLPAGGGTLKVWFSPNTPTKTKDAKKIPVDMKEVFEIIENAKEMVLFLLFNPGTPSIVAKIKEVAEAKQKIGKSLFVRGAISDAKTAADGEVRVFSRSATKRADTVITGVAGVPDDFGYWERELLKLGHATIHDKVLVVDPFSTNSVVVTGSHNLGYKASYSNDENLVIIRRNRRVAEAFTTHVLDVVNHYRWRYKLQKLHREDRLADAWQDLDETDRWQNKYFDTGFLESQDRYFIA